MDALKTVSLCALFFTPPDSATPCYPPTQASSSHVERWKPLIAEAAHSFSIQEAWIAAVMKLESGGLTTFDGKPITSRAGAMGLMQLMPATYADMRARYDLGADPYDPHDNIFAGAAYLREMFNRYGYPNLFAAYHAGPGHVDAFLAGLKPLPQATQAYLNAIVPDVKNALTANENPMPEPSKTVRDPLFFVRADVQKSSSETSNSAPKTAIPDTKIDPNSGPNGVGLDVDYGSRHE